MSSQEESNEGNDGGMSTNFLGNEIKVLSSLEYTIYNLALNPSTDRHKMAACFESILVILSGLPKINQIKLKALHDCWIRNMDWIRKIYGHDWYARVIPEFSPFIMSKMKCIKLLEKEAGLFDEPESTKKNRWVETINKTKGEL